MGFIDSGMLLAQDNPERLIFKYSCTSLEDVFLELCLQKGGQTIKNHDTIKEVPEEEEQDEEEAKEVGNPPEINNNGELGGERQSAAKLRAKLNARKAAKKSSSFKRQKEAPTSLVLSTANLSLAKPSAKSAAESFHHARPPTSKSKSDSNGGRNLASGGRPARDVLNCSRLLALLTKNYILFKRNPVAIILLNVLPIVQIALYCISFERNPQHIRIAVVNRDNRTNSLSNVSCRGCC